MSVVGGFPGLAQMRRRTVRAPVNPIDKSTIVSIYPKEITEKKVTIEPGVFNIKAGSYEKPSTLVVGPSSWWREIDEEQPLLEIPVSSVLIAKSVVVDYCNGVLACDMGESMPGLFFVPGEHNAEAIKKLFPHELEAAKKRQIRHYSELIKLADALWARSNSNPMCISDDMRLAARELALPNKDWMADFVNVGMVRCFACGTLKNPEFPVCAACRAIDASHPKAKDIKFAQ